MRRIAFFVFLITAISSSAATILKTITSGTADLVEGTVPSGNESFSLSGPGFSFTGSGVVSSVVCGRNDPCLPGTRIKAPDAGLSSEDRGITGSITIGSTPTFFYAEFPGFGGGAGIGYDFNLSTPATNPPSSLTLTGPFTATAGFLDRNFESGNTFLFFGSGDVTIHLSFFPGAGFIPAQYELQSMHFAFSSLPELSTGTMVVAGILMVGVWHFRKKIVGLNRG